MVPAQTLAEANARLAETESRLAEAEIRLAAANARIIQIMEWAEAEISRLTARVQELEAQLKQNSSNSSRPPSSDFGSQSSSPKLPKKKKGLRRKRGGQKGHARKAFEPLPPERVEKIIDCKPEHCRCCGEPLIGEDADAKRHQIIELPKIEVKAVEYRLHRLGCPTCGITTRGELPPGVSWGNYGPRLSAFIAMLTGMCRMSKRLAQGLMQDAFGVKMSLGAVSKQEHLVSEAVAASVAEAHAYIKTQHRVFADETGWREKMKKAWLWVVVTGMVTVFLIRRSRGSAVAQELLGETFEGILHSDRWHGYRWVDERQRQVCWAHLLRHFIAFEDLGPPAKRLGRKLQKQTQQMFYFWVRLRDGTLTRQGFVRKMKPIECEIVRLLSKGENCATPKVASRCREILRLEPALFTFVHHEDVEPTNNAAERAIRHAVIWRKSSLGTDSERGSRFVERILTVVATLRSQNRNVLQWLTDAGEAKLNKVESPSLLPSITLSTEQPAQLAA